MLAQILDIVDEEAMRLAIAERHPDRVEFAAREDLFDQPFEFRPCAGSFSCLPCCDG